MNGRATACLAATLLALAGGDLSGRVAAQTPGQVSIFGAAPVSGDIVGVSPLGVEVEAREETVRVPIETIREVSFVDEPKSLKDARISIMRGQHAQAIDDIAKIEPADMEGAAQLVADELAFVKAAAVGGQAAGGSGDLAAAQQTVRDYLAKHGQSHHSFFMLELLSTLMGRSGKYAEAAEVLKPLESGPPAYRVRAATARAGLLYDQKKWAEAAAEYAAATKIVTDEKDVASGRQKRAAELGAARSQVRLGKPTEAISAIQGVIDAAADDETLGRAYNALGDAQATAGKEQDAIIAYLTVDLVYNKTPENRSEALFNLGELWERGKFPTRAEAARQELGSAYPDSPWAKRVTVGK